MSESLGKRICIIGPSSAGKSTLAENLGQKRGYEVLHLDQIAHIPHTNWLRCPLSETQEKHDNFIQKDSWVIEGNYGFLMPQRLLRADTVILHHFNRFGCAYRFVRRALKKKPDRAGKLHGSIETVKIDMIKYILFDGPQKFKNYLKKLENYPHLKIIHVYSFKEINNLIERGIPCHQKKKSK